MKHVVVILLILFSCSAGFAREHKILYAHSQIEAGMDAVQAYFEKVLPDKNTIIFTQVPRGLVVSIDEREFFDTGSFKIKPEAAPLLNSIADALRKFDNPCVVESHTDEPLSGLNGMSYDWELTIMRANAIADYLVIKNKLPYRRVFPLGYGEMMPFNDNVAVKDFSDRRVDFVIFDNSISR